MTTMQMVVTDRHGKPVEKPFFWSWSTLHDFETCAKKYYHNKLAKDFPSVQTPEMNWGKAVHAAIHDRIMHDKPLPSGMEQYEHWCHRVVSTCRPGMTVTCEHQMAIDVTFQPCKWFDKEVQPWFRSAADVLRRFEDVAHIIDWKTNKRIDYDTEQLEVSAVNTFIHYPEVQKIRTDFVWLQHGAKTTAYIHRNDVPSIWQKMMPRVNKMREALQLTSYPPNPSGLCVNWCNVRSCPYYGKGTR